VEVGVNASSERLSGKDLADFESGVKPGIAVGASVAFPVTPTIAIQPEVLFFQSNSKLDGVRSFSGFTSNIAVSVVEIPVLVKFDLSPMKMPDWYVVAGPAVGFIASAKQKDIKFGSQTESDDDLKANNEVESTVFGVVFGAGFTRGSWGVEVRYDLGLTNTAHNKPGEDASLKNGTVTGLFRWYFPHK